MFLSMLRSLQQLLLVFLLQGWLPALHPLQQLCLPSALLLLLLLLLLLFRPLLLCGVACGLAGAAAPCQGPSCCSSTTRRTQARSGLLLTAAHNLLLLLLLLGAVAGCHCCCRWCCCQCRRSASTCLPCIALLAPLCKLLLRLLQGVQCWLVAAAVLVVFVTMALVVEGGCQ